MPIATRPEPEADPFGAEVRRRVADRLPIGLLLLGVLAIVGGAFEAFIFPERTISVVVSHAALFATFPIGVWIARRRPDWSVAVMVVCVNVTALVVVSYYAWNDGSAEWCLLVLTALLTTATLFLPWGWGPQLTACTTAAVGYPLALLGGAVPVLPAATGLFFLGNVIGLTTIGAGLLQRYPRADFLLTRDLQEREARLRSYFDQALIGIAILALDQVCLEANDELCQILGYDRRDLLDRKWSELSHAEDLAPERAELERIVRGESDGYSLDKRLVRKDGTVCHALVSAKCIRSREGHPLRLILMVQDMTARKRAEVDLLRAKEHAERADRSKTELLARMSHKLRTPMNVIFGMTEMALDSSATPEQRDVLQKTWAAARKLLVLVDDVLDYSKLDAGRLALEPKRFLVRPWLDDLVRPLSDGAREKGLDIGWQVAEDVPEAIVSDPERLGQVVANLVRNAIKFTERGDIRVVIERAASHAELPDPGLHISVRDTGIGIPEALHETIFAGFVQEGPSASPAGGTGLGLAICSRVVRLMGGRIWVESAQGNGSCFHVATPLDLGEGTV